MAWSRARTLAAGGALILVTNAIALWRAAENRSGEPESVLQLSERELAELHAFADDREDSGITARLQWRVVSRASDEVPHTFALWGAEPEWLDQAKLASLGLPAPPRPRPGLEHRDYPDRKKDVFLVLELDGPARQEQLRRARAFADREVALQRAAPGEERLAESARDAREIVEREESGASRLFVVDAGLDAQSLRGAYPDRTRYAIARGRVSAPARDTGRTGETGRVDALDVSEINVPVEFRHVFEAARGKRDARYQATVAFGKRFEPWIVSASTLPAD